MQIRINGTTQSVPQNSTLAALIERLALGGKRLAVEVNGEIVPRSTYAARELKDEDVVEIVQAIGGG
jgi:sulfur carrier protein